MKINLAEAVKQFYSNPSLDLVYFEAIANSLDALATEILLHIKINSFDEADTLKIVIEDNGSGFDNRGFIRFCKLLETDNLSNKGIGRLIFLHYFSEGIYNTNSEEFQRSFTLNKDFDGQFKEKCNLDSNGTKLELQGYKLQKINRYDYLKAESLQKAIELHFLPRLFLLKKAGRKIEIKIKVDTQVENPKQGFFSDCRTISTDNLPAFKDDTFKVPCLDLYHEFKLFYLVEQNYENNAVKIAIASDYRTIDMSNIISKDSLPDGYSCIFIISSEYFDGKASNSRQKLDIDEDDLKNLKHAIIHEIKVKLEQEIPNLVDRNKKQKEYLDNRFPHLVGFFEDEVVGIIDKDKLIEKAQAKFFKEQKSILEADSLDDIQYEKSLEVSSRVLTEYILYRNLIIQKLKETNKDNSEAEVHNLIIPMRKSYYSSERFEHLYRNNAWLLDDKFMTYSTILSDQSLQKLLNEIKIDEELELDKNTKPDISIVFNGDPEKEKVDVVVIEIKPRFDDLHENEKAISQIQRRARRLLSYYPDKIQRLWFYAIIDINDELELVLKSNDYQEIFSSGKTFYKSQKIFYSNGEKKTFTSPIDITVLSYDAMLNDAQSRNSTFLELLKETIKQQSNICS